MKNNFGDSGNCIYRVVTGRTLEELEKNVNDLLGQGWNTDVILGETGKDENGYFQVIMICPNLSEGIGSRQNP